MRKLRNLGAWLALALLAACGTIDESNVGQVRVGAFVVQQSPVTDDVAINRRGSAYYGEIRRRFDAGEAGFAGWSGTATLSVRSGGREVWVQQVTVTNGFVRETVNVPLAYSTMVCLKLPPGARVTHQQDRPEYLGTGEHGACSSQGHVADHARQMRRTNNTTGTALVIVIVARGSTVGR